MCTLIMDDAESAGVIDDCKKIDIQKFKGAYEKLQASLIKKMLLNRHFIYCHRINCL